MVKFNDAGFGADVFTLNSYYGITASSIFYDLTGSDSYFFSDYYAGEIMTEMEVEEEFIRQLVEAGAEQISTEEMSVLRETAQYTVGEVEWLD